MADFMLEYLSAGRPGPNLHVVTAGTHTIDGQPMSRRTWAALRGIPELVELDFKRHRSRQVSEGDLVRAELIVVMEANHVRFVRRQFPDAADRTATIRQLCRTLPPAPPTLGERVATLALTDAPLFDEDDVIDPAGGDDATYVACVSELWLLCRQLITLL
jgi:protein-tyrosine-phosphatase